MSRKKQVYEKITALYCRISLDDGGDNESMSISNQKLMLRDFAEKHGMFQYEYYVDDGYTGRNFNRPAFQRATRQWSMFLFIVFSSDVDIPSLMTAERQ